MWCGLPAVVGEVAPICFGSCISGRINMQATSGVGEVLPVALVGQALRCIEECRSAILAARRRLRDGGAGCL